jgi:hypothetical protein
LLAQENQLLREQNRLLEDEIAHLKGEKGKPKIPPNVPPRGKSPKTVKPKKWSKRLFYHPMPFVLVNTK